MTKSKYNLKVQQWIAAISVVLFSIKVVAYYLTHSLAILTDALESIVNVVAGGIGLYSLYVAAKPSDEEHPYGHGKAEYVSAAIEGTLIAAAGLIILYETIISFGNHKVVHKLDSGLVLLGITAIINYVAGIICYRIGKKNKSMALMASGKHLQTDTFSTVAVIIGLIIILFTNLFWIDQLIAIGLAFYILYNGYKIIRQSLAGIMDEQDMQLLKEIVITLNQNRKVNWIDLHNFRTIKYGAQLHIDCHLTVPWYLNVHEAHKEVDALTNLLRENYGNTIEFFVHTDGCLPFSCQLCQKEDCTVRQYPFEQKIEWTLDNLLSDKKHRIANVVK